jgi:putative aldouronate transport system substrate-binding protein
MKKFVFLTTILLLSAATALFAGGQTEGAGTASPDEDVELVMYLVGDTQPDYDAMLEVVNAKLDEDINATLDVNFTTWSGWDTKYNLLLSAGEEFDLIFASEWTKYQEFARKGAYLELDELLPVYAPQTWENIPEDGWKQTKVDGNIYMVPMNALEFQTHGLLYRLDLAREYGIGKIEDIDDMEAFYAAIAENEDVMLPLNAGPEGPGNEISHVWSADPSYRPYPWDEAANKLFRRYLDEDEWFFPLDRFGSDFFERTREWYQAGYWPRSILSSQVSARDNLRNGTSASAILNTPNANDDSKAILAAHPEWELDWFNLEHRFPVNERRPLIGNGMAINDNARHPERALMFLELVHNDFDYYMLMTNGIEGEHWELTDADTMAFPEGVDASNTGFAWDAPCPWGWREERFHLGGILQNPNTMPFIREWWDIWQEDAILNPDVNFAFDPTPVATELAALSNVQSTYSPILRWGVADTEETFNEYISELEAAGLREVEAELNAQWQEYKQDK